MKDTKGLEQGLKELTPKQRSEMSLAWTNEKENKCENCKKAFLESEMYNHGNKWYCSDCEAKPFMKDLKKFEFIIEVMGKEVYCGEWEAEDINEADLEIQEVIEVSIKEAI